MSGLQGCLQAAGPVPTFAARSRLCQLVGIGRLLIDKQKIAWHLVIALNKYGVAPCLISWRQCCSAEQENTLGDASGDGM